MRKLLFRTLAGINRLFLPSFKHRDLTKLTSVEKMIVGWRYWVTCNALE